MTLNWCGSQQFHGGKTVDTVAVHIERMEKADKINVGYNKDLF